jgi:hypothetical protein
MSNTSHTHFFFNLGNNDRLTLDASKPLHTAYAKGDATQRTTMRKECMVAYIMGKLAVSDKVADRILSQTRTERGEKQQNAYRLANERFTYHVSRTNNKVKPQAKSYRIDPKMRDTAMSFLAEFEGETLVEQIKAAKALLSAMV